MGIKNTIMFHCCREVKCHRVSFLEFRNRYITFYDNQFQRMLVAMVSTSEFGFGGWRLFPRRTWSMFAFQFWWCELSLKNQWGRDRSSNFIIYVVCSALIASGWVVVAWSKKSCLGPAEIASFVCRVLFKDNGCRMIPRFHLFVSDVNQGNEEAG